MKKMALAALLIWGFMAALDSFEIAPNTAGSMNKSAAAQIDSIN